MADVMVPPARRAAEAENAQITRTTTAKSHVSWADDRRRPSGGRRGPRVFSGRVLLTGLGAAVAWGLFLWLVIGGSIASFGTPWLYS